MGYMKGGLAHFSDGNTTSDVADEKKDDTVGTAKSQPVKIGKYITLPAATGTTPIPSSTLENLQKEYEARKAEKSSFLERMKDAQAWLSGGIYGPTQGLQQRGQERSQQAAELFQMQNAIEGYKAQQERNKNIAASLGNVLSGGAPTGGTSASPIEVPAPVAAEINRLIKLQDYEGAQKKYDEWFKGETTESTKFKYNPAAMERKYEIITPDGKLDLVDADEYMRLKKANLAKPTGKTVDVPKAGSDVTAKDIEHVESRGKTDAIGPVVPGQGTAKGSMQVMDKTATDPGFGVKPAQLTGDKVKDEAELKRVGVDYFEALKTKYKHPSLAAAAYVWGPGNLDAWVKDGSKLEKLPPEVKDYVAKVNLTNAVSGAPNQFAGTTTTTTTTATPKVTLPEARTKAEAEKTYATGTAGEFAKTVEADRKTFETNVSPTSVAERSTAADTTESLLKKYPKAVGVLSEPSFKNAVATILKEGISTPRGHIGIKGIEEAIFKGMPEADKPTAEARYTIATNLARTELETSRLAQGQGTISDAERALFQRIAGGIGDPATLLIKKVQMIKARSELDRELGAMYRAANRSGFVDYNKFRNSEEFQNKVAAYEARLKDIAGNVTPGNPQADLDARIDRALGKKTK